MDKSLFGNIIVYLREGVYKISETVQFTPQDSGFNKNKIIYRAFKDEKPILTGGVSITDWKLYDKKKNIYRAIAPKSIFRQVYINNKPAIRSRTPNRKSETSFGPYWQAKITNKQKILIAKKNWEACADIKQLEEIELVLESHWYHQRIRIGQHIITGSNVIITPANPNGKLTKKQNFYDPTFFFFENALSLIDTADEWYHDCKKGYLYLAVKKGINPNKLYVEVPSTQTLIAIQGLPKRQVHDIEFQGITFQTSNWDSPSKYGLNTTQFTQPIGVKRTWKNSNYPMGIIKAIHAQKIGFRKNVIRNTGAHGIQFFSNVDNSDIEGNQFYQIAANAIEIDTHALRNPLPTQQSINVAIWNNHIRKAGQNYTNGGGILAHNVFGLIVEHNLIHDMPYSCIQIGNQPKKGQNFKDIGAGNNKIRYNQVHHCMQLHDDGGGIYTLGGAQKGSVIAKNYLHSIERTKWAGNYKIDMIYLDNYTSKILIKNNVVVGGRVAERNGSKGNILLNNMQTNSLIQRNSGVKRGYNPRKNNRW